MKEDLERFLMEIEEQYTWVSYELNARNYSRLTKDERIRKAKELQSSKLQSIKDEEEQENGLSFNRGQISSYKRWQNSPSKYLDFVGHIGPVFSCKLSKDLQYILSASADKTMRLWKASSGKLVMTYLGHKKSVNDCDFHPHLFEPDSKIPCIISCSGDTTLRFWNTSSDQALRVLNGHEEAVYKCVFSPDGQRLVSCSEDMTIRTWSFPEGFNLFVYRGHQAPVITTTFSPTGKFILSGSDYGERKLFVWDSMMPRFEIPEQYPNMIFWTPDGLIKRILIQKTIPDYLFWLNEVIIIVINIINIIIINIIII